MNGTFRVLCLVFVAVVLLAWPFLGVAAEVDSDAVDDALTDDQAGVSSQEDPPPVSLSLPDEPLEVVIVEDVTPYAVSGSGYSGMISSQYVDYFKGIVSKYPFRDYLLFRSDLYSYTLVYDADLSVSGTSISGTGRSVVYYSRSGDTTLRWYGSDSVSLSLPNVSAYSNLGDFPSFTGVYSDVYTFAALVFFVSACLVAFVWVFFFRRVGS